MNTYNIPDPEAAAIGIDLGGTKTEAILLAPDAVVLGGGLSNIEELCTTGRDHVRRYAFHDDLRTQILKNQLGDSAGVFGAAWIGQAGKS